MVNEWKEVMVAGDTAENFVPGGDDDGEVAQDENATNLNESAQLDDTEMAVVKEASSTHEERDGLWPTKERDGQLQASQALKVQKAASAETVPAMEESSRRPERLDKKRSPELPMQRRNSKRLHTIAESTKIMDNAHTMDEDNLGAKPRRRGRRSTDESTFERPNNTIFAAITPKNIDLIYLRRTLLRELLGDPEFCNKVVGTFVGIRVPEAVSKTEIIYRLVLVTGTKIDEENYQAGPSKTTNILLEVLNQIQKKEVVTVNQVSDEDFTEEECQRLRQSIKRGFIKPLTVRQVEKKAIALREDKLNHWLESEKPRMIDLQDRANEYLEEPERSAWDEKLRKLSNPEFPAAKLQAMPEVTSDPHMDPGYESDALDREESLHHRSRDSIRDHGRRGYYDGRRSGENLGAGGDSNFPRGDTKAAGSIPVEDPWDFHLREVKAAGSTPVFEQVTRPRVRSKVVSSATQASRSALRTPTGIISETEKMWHYLDPIGIVQGPFSMEQLRNWNTNQLTIWKTDNNTKNSEVLLTDALAGKFTFLEGSSTGRGDHRSSRFLATPDSHVLVDSPKVDDVWGSLGDGGSQKSLYGRRSSKGGYEYDALKRDRDGSRSGSGRGRVRERKDVHCRFYAKRCCKRGKDCEFRHF